MGNQSGKYDKKSIRIHSVASREAQNISLFEWEMSKGILFLQNNARFATQESSPSLVSNQILHRLTKRKGRDCWERQKTSQELRMLSRSPSDCRSLLLNLNLNLNRCLCSDCSDCSDCSAILVLLSCYCSAIAVLL